MPKKKKAFIFNSIMALAILAIIGGAVLLVGDTRGWFDRENRMAAAGVRGNVTITRNAIAYSLQSGTPLREGDQLETGSGDTAKIVIDGDKGIDINENTAITLRADESGGEAKIELHSGELFCEMSPEESGGFPLLVSSGSGAVSTAGAVFSVADASDVVTVSVFAGSVELSAGEQQQIVEAGRRGVVLTSGGKDEIIMSALTAESLNEFTISKAIASAGNRSLCLTAAALQNVLEERELEAARARQEAEANLVTLLAQGGNVVVDTGSAGEASQPAGSKDSESRPADTQASGKQPSGQQSSDTQSKAASQPSEPPADSKKPVFNCTFEIRCDTILNNMGDLTPGKDKYVPANGVILGTSTAQFYEGESVFDVLKRVCTAAEIQLEYNYYPIYESVYIEGINHLYEFDCGPQSGWMFKVNGWFPNYGAGKYYLKDGDVVVWCYTCQGLGKDVGCDWME